VRTVKVGLEADVGGFKTGVDSAKRSVDDLDDKVEALDRDLEKIPPDALKAAAAVKALGDGVKGAADHLDTMAAKSAGLSVLDQKLAESRAEVKKLTEEFIRTGDMDVFERLGRASANERSLSGIRRRLATTLEEGAQDGARAAVGTFASMLQGGIASAFQSLPPEIKAGIMAVLGVAAVAAIPVIVAAIDAALLLGIGAGGLAAGIAVAAQDAKVQQAYSDLGSHIMSTLGKAVTPIRTELVAAAATFGKSFDAITPNINRMAGTLSKAIAPIAHGLGGLFENAAPGLEKAFQGALPLLREFGEWLPKLGDEIGDLGKALANAEPEAEAFFKFVLANVDLAVNTVTFLTNGIHALAGAMMRWVGQYQPISPALADDKTAMDNLAESSANVADQVKSIGTAFTEMGQSIEGSLTSKILDSMFAMDDATIKWQESLAKLDDTAKKNGTSLDVLNEKTGRYNDKALANEKTLIASAKANADLYEQNLKSGMAASDAAAIYEKNTETLRKQAIAAGFNAKEVDNLIGKYGKVPERVQTILATIGLTNALDHLAQILIDFKSLNDKEFKTKYTVTTEYIVKHTGTSGGKEGGASYSYGMARGGIRKAATGLIIPPSDPGTVLTGEPQTGGELLLPMKGITQDRAYQLIQAVAPGYGLNVSRGGGGMPTGLTVSFAGDTDSTFATGFMKLVRNGVIQFGVN
jgi:hypothetical protein